MQITIINGGFKDDTRLQGYLDGLSSGLMDRDFKVKNFKLVEMRLNYCCGCFSCWVKTPGRCIYSDDMEELLKEYLRSKVVIFVSAILSGFVSSLLRKATERLLPLLHAYLSIKDGKVSHAIRYNTLPYLVLLVDDSKGGSLEEINLINDIHARMNLNYKFTKLVKEDMRGTIDAIEHLCGIS